MAGNRLLAVLGDCSVNIHILFVVGQRLDRCHIDVIVKSAAAELSVFCSGILLAVERQNAAFSLAVGVNDTGSINIDRIRVNTYLADFFRLHRREHARYDGLSFFRNLRLFLLRRLLCIGNAVFLLSRLLCIGNAVGHG